MSSLSPSSRKSRESIQKKKETIAKFEQIHPSDTKELVQFVDSLASDAKVAMNKHKQDVAKIAEEARRAQGMVDPNNEAKNRPLKGGKEWKSMDGTSTSSTSLEDYYNSDFEFEATLSTSRSNSSSRSAQRRFLQEKKKAEETQKRKEAIKKIIQRKKDEQKRKDIEGEADNDDDKDGNSLLERKKKLMMQASPVFSQMAQKNHSKSSDSSWCNDISMIERIKRCSTISANLKLRGKNSFERIKQAAYTLHCIDSISHPEKYRNHRDSFYNEHFSTEREPCETCPRGSLFSYGSRKMHSKKMPLWKIETYSCSRKKRTNSICIPREPDEFDPDGLLRKGLKAGYDHSILQQNHLNHNETEQETLDKNEEKAFTGPPGHKKPKEGQVRIRNYKPNMCQAAGYGNYCTPTLIRSNLVSPVATGPET